MATIPKGLLSAWQPTLQFVRFRKVNIQKPFPPHFTRAKVEHICKPIFAKTKYQDPNVPLHEICRVDEKYFAKQKDEENPYLSLLARDLLNWFNHSKLIAFFHKNPMDSDELFEARLLLKKKNEMRLKLHGRQVVTKAVEGTKYEAVLAFYHSDTVVAFGPEANVPVFMKTLKKIPKLVLLGAVVDDRLLSRAEVEFYGSLPDIQSVRAGLVSLLQSAAQGVVSNLNHHQSQLVQHLNKHIELSNKKQ